MFRHGDAWYMVYVAFQEGVGYETRLARSEDLVGWTSLGTVLPFRDDGWDRWQADAGVALFYNGKQEGPWVERIGMAVSEDLIHWSRLGDGPVIDDGSGISGDPQVVRMGDLWVMFYFGAGWQPQAFDTFAASYDLVHWTQWTGPHLKQPSEPWGETYAHKPWLVKHEGVVYHFYAPLATRAA